MVIDDLYYGDNCSCCAGHFHNEAAHSFAINSEVLQEYLRTIYKGFDTSDAIEPTMWRAVLKVLNEATVEGLSRSNTDTHDCKFLASLRHSNEVFAAFKVHSMGEKMAEKLLDDKGKLKPFREWKEDVKGIASHYVGSWLETEYNTAVIRAHNAADWQQFERDADIMPNLRWMPTTSPHPESSHKKFWERQLTLPVSDPFWDKHHPGDRWNCKCSLEQTDEPATPELKEEFRGEKPQRGLANNPGKDGRMFSQDHPYFPKSCSKCSFNKGLKNRVRTFFRNEQKDCYECANIDFVIPTTKEGLKKMTSEQKHKIYSMPINEQFEEVEENVFRHRLKSTDEEDYKRLLDVAKSYAKDGNQVWILPEIHQNEVDIRKKLGLRSKTQTPDLWINQKWHVDAKSPHKYSNIIHNANEASKQGGIACVTNHFVDLKESQLNRLKDSILKNNYYQEAEVHFYIDGTLYKYNSQGIILG